MRAVDELQDPVGYDDRWLLLAALALALVAAYYAAVLWWGRERPPRTRRRPPRESCLRRLEEIESAVAAGSTPPRQGHQQISETVRGFVAAAAGVPAQTMTLSDFERAGMDRIADVVALVYPPAFGPSETLARERFGDALARARELVSSWT